MRTLPPVILFYLTLISTLALSAQEHPYLLESSKFKEAPSALGIDPDGKQVLAGFYDGSIRLLDPQSLEAHTTIKQAHFKAVHAIEPLPGQKQFISAGHREISLWDSIAGKINTWSKHNTSVWNLRISPDGHWLVSSAINKTFLLWDLQAGKFIQGMKGHSDVCMAVDISPDSKRIASGAKDRMILVWDIESRQVLYELNGPPVDVYDLKFSPCGNWLAAASKENKIRIYNLEKKKLEKLLIGNHDRVMELEFSPCGRYLISGSADGRIMLWDLAKGNPEFSFPAYEAAVLDMVFHPDGRSFYSAAFSGELSHWSIDPEIFVNNYYRDELDSTLVGNPIFAPRQEAESRKQYQLRSEKAVLCRQKVVDSLYQVYLEEQFPE